MMFLRISLYLLFHWLYVTIARRMMDTVQDLCNHGHHHGNHGNHGNKHSKEPRYHGNCSSTKDQMSLCNVSGVGNVSYNQQTISFIIEMEHRMRQVIAFSLKSRTVTCEFKYHFSFPNTAVNLANTSRQLGSYF